MHLFCRVPGMRIEYHIPGACPLYTGTSSKEYEANMCAHVFTHFFTRVRIAIYMHFIIAPTHTYYSIVLNKNKALLYILP